jgi:hypothetical protein
MPKLLMTMLTVVPTNALALGWTMPMAVHT